MGLEPETLCDLIAEYEKHFDDPCPQCGADWLHWQTECYVCGWKEIKKMSVKIKQISSHHTVVFRDDMGVYTCMYHQTPIMRWNEKRVILKADGWLTATTKKRMNQIAEAYKLPIKVYQKDLKWYVKRTDTKETLDFKDGMVLKL